MNGIATVERLNNFAEESRVDAMVSMFERAVMDPSLPMERVAQIIELHNAELQRRAKLVWSQKMSLAQSEMQAVIKNRPNKQTNSDYATYDALDAAVRPIYARHGFSVVYNTEATAQADLVRIVAFVENGGFERRFDVEMPCDGKGAKGGDVMTKTHAMKSAVTYGKATLLPMIFNIAVRDRSDDDGNRASNGARFVTEQQALELRDLLEATEANVPQFLKAAKVDRIEDIPTANFRALCDAIRRRAAERGAK